MAKPMKGQIIDGYIFQGGDPNDQKNWKSVMPSMSESMAEELGGRNFLGKAAAGLGVAANRARFGAKGLVTELSPQEQERLAFDKQIGATGGGKVGSIAGDIAMQYLPMGSIAKAAGKLPGLLRTAGSILGPAAVGAGYGAVTSPGERAEGAVRGGLGAATGAALAHGASGIARPLAGSDAEFLMQQGARLTPGQVMGGVTKSAEDAARMINPSIAARQQEAIGDVNRIAVNERLAAAGLSPAKGVGHKLIKEASDEFGQAYEAAGVKPIAADAQFSQGIQQIRATHAPFLTTKELDELDDLIRVSNNMTGGAKNSAAIRTFENELSAKATKADSNMKNALGSLKGEIEGLRTRLGATTPQLDKPYAEFGRMKEAAAQNMDTGLFTPGQVQKMVSKKSSVGQKATGKALMQEEMADLNKILGDTIPKVGPGTAEKAFWGTVVPGSIATSVLTGSAIPAAATLGTLGASKAAYTPAGVQFMTGQYPWQQYLPPEVQAAIAASGGALWSNLQPRR
jgi:hypothetical protein